MKMTLEQDSEKSCIMNIDGFEFSVISMYDELTDEEMEALNEVRKRCNNNSTDQTTLDK